MDLQQFDQQHIWHPYTSVYGSMPAYVVAQASGARLTLADGRQLIDGMSSWWCVIHGYNHPKLNAAIIEQTQRFAHVMFGGLTHEPAVRLATQLLALVPSHLTQVFFADSGSVAVEVAMKMALQYQQARGASGRIRFATILGGYHGDTWHPMSVCDPKTGMHALYHGRLAEQYFLPRPRSRFAGEFYPEDAQALEDFFTRYGHEVAGFIIEPIVQGAGGMWFYHPEYLRLLAQYCARYAVVLVVDEIATGFGRTGKLFALEHAGVAADIVCLGKALTGGYMSFAATLCSKEVAETISAGTPGVMMHGPTFMGNPLACAVSSASLDLLSEGHWQGQVERIEALLQAYLSPLLAWQSVVDVRVLGAIGVVEWQEAVVMERIVPMFVEAGVWVRPFGRLVYVMPPFTISQAELRQLLSALVAVLAVYEEGGQ